jgi:hypothetical protein
MKRVAVLAFAGLVAGLAFLAGCDDVDLLTPNSLAGVSFTFDGDTTGGYAAAGLPTTLEGQPEFGSWAISTEPDSLGGLIVSAFRATEQPKGDLFVLQLAPLRTGSFTPCEPNAACHGRVIFGYDGGGYEDYFEIVSGSATIDEIGEDRISGTFRFVARDEGGTGNRTLTVDDGTFAVPFVATVPQDELLCLISGGC